MTAVSMAKRQEWSHSLIFSANYKETVNSLWCGANGILLTVQYKLFYTGPTVK